MNKLDNLFKFFKTIVSLFALTLIIYGIFTIIMPNKFKKTQKEETKKEVKSDFNYNQKLKYLDNDIMYNNESSFNSKLMLNIATLNIKDNEFEKVESIDIEVEGYYFNHKKIKASIIDNYIKKIFGDKEYEKVNFQTRPDNYYYYLEEDDSYYLFERLVEYILCENKFSFDDKDLVINQKINCPNDNYNVKYTYKYDKDKKDYFIFKIELIGE